MLTGTADPEVLAGRAPVMDALDAPPAAFAGVEVLQATFEMPAAVRQTTLPPALHPTNPPLLVLLAWRVSDSPWGPFSMAQARVSCRSGVRPRGFVAGCVVDNPVAAAALAASWGLPARAGAVVLERAYHAVTLRVETGSATAAELVAVNPDPLSPGDVQYTVTMTLAHTPRGVRLVQLEPEYRVDRVERVRPRLGRFEGSAWGEAGLDPVHPVSATIAAGDVTIPALRYVCRPDVLAFEGTEGVG